MAPSSARQWLRRITAVMKDRRSLYLRRLSAKGGQMAEMEVAVIRATSHDEHSIDYKNAALVFAWARTSPAFLAPLLRVLTRRAIRTRSWAVALKTLLIAHGVILCSAAASSLGRLPFDLSDFRDRSALPSSASHGFSAFVRAYFQFLDQRSVLVSSSFPPRFIHEDAINYSSPSPSSPFPSSSYSKLLPPIPGYSLRCIGMLAKMQDLLDLLMQIRPYSDGMTVVLILDAMDCAIIEIFEVYSCICKGIAGFLADVLEPNNPSAAANSSKGEEERRQLGMAGIRVLRRATEQSGQLSAYFSLCRTLGVLNAIKIPPVEVIPEEDICDLVAVLWGGISEAAEDERFEKGKAEEKWMEQSDRQSKIVVTEEWELFDDKATAVPATAMAVATPFVNDIQNPLVVEEEA